MLYQQQPKFKLSRIFARLAMRIRAMFATGCRHGSDMRYLDGASDHLLGDIGLRRSEDRSYRTF